MDAIDKSPAELERVVRAIAGHTAGEPVLSPLRPPAPPVAVGDGDDDDEEFEQLSDTGEQGESGSQEAGAAAGSAVRASARERAPPARLDLGPSSKTTKGGAGSKSDTRDKENRGGAKRNGRGGKSGPRGRDDLGNPAPLKYARRGANAAIPAGILKPRDPLAFSFASRARTLPLYFPVVPHVQIVGHTLSDCVCAVMCRYWAA